MHHVLNGQQALDFLRRAAPYQDMPTPGLIVLDLNMPVLNGHEFLAQAKADPLLRSIPVLVLSTSEHPRDIRGAYYHHANGYVVKPGNIAEYQDVLQKVTAYWNGTVKLPLIEELTL